MDAARATTESVILNVSNENKSGREEQALMNLPDKCLISIFKWIPLQNLDDIIELSPRCDKLIQQHIPVEVHITDIGFRVAMHYFMGHDDLPKYRIRIIHSRVLDERLPELKSPEDLQIAEFATHTEPATFTSLVGKAVNLEQLTFGYGSLCSHPLSELEFDFPHLKSLVISDRTLASRNAIQALENNIIGFLQRTFPSIEDLQVTTMATRTKTVDYIKALLKFMQVHHGSIRKVRFHVNTSGQNQESLSGRVNDLVDLGDSEEGTWNQEALQSLQLKELDVTLGNNFFVGLDQWTSLLNSQSQLEHLKFGIDKPLPPSIYLTPINQSASTLVSLQLGVEVFDEGSDQRSPIDCSIFQNCSSLKMIVLIGPSKTELRPPSPELLNVDKLPKGLFGLGVENIFVETSQFTDLAKFVLQKMSKLERISLKNIGTKENYGVTLNMLDAWLSSEVLSEIIVTGLNGDECQLHQFEQIVRFGVKAPLDKCEFHVMYEPSMMEYRKPTHSA